MASLTIGGVVLEIPQLKLGVIRGFHEDGTLDKCPVTPGAFVASKEYLATGVKVIKAALVMVRPETTEEEIVAVLDPGQAAECVRAALSMPLVPKGEA